MSYQEEQDKLLSSFLNYYFTAWKEENCRKEKYGNFIHLELIINSKCNLACKYCYFNRYGEKLIPSCPDEVILKNTDILLKFLRERKLVPEFEIFSGEPLVQKIGFQVIEKIVDAYKDSRVKPRIIVPTNGTFLLSKRLTKKVEELLEKGKRNGIKIILSFSIDGKYCEANRPFKNRKKDPRDDKYFEKCFKFAKKYGFGFHPMIYSERIEKWKENFLWFQENFKRFKLPPTSLYLLEVRNEEWTPRQIVELMKFLNFLVKWAWKECGENKEKFLNFLFKKKGFNILQGPLITWGRGIGCSIQSTITVRLSDLAIVPCHRTSYPPFIAGYFRVKNGKIVGIKAHNPELFIAIMTFDAKTQPMCETCLLKELCSFGCLGAQYETTGSLFTPIPTVCLLEHGKVLAILLALEEIGILEDVKKRIKLEKQITIEEVLKIWKDLKQ